MQVGPARRPGHLSSPEVVGEAVLGRTTADGVPLAGFWWRTLAVVLDALLLGVVGFVLTLPFMGPFFDGLAAFWGEAMEAARSGGPTPIAPTFTELLPLRNQMGIMLVTAALQIGYHALLWRHWGATLGQRALGLRVVPVGNGRETERLTYNQLVPRAVIWGVPWCLSSLYVLGAINAGWSLWNPRRQAIHDLVARTQVVRIRA